MLNHIKELKLSDLQLIEWIVSTLRHDTIYYYLCSAIYSLVIVMIFNNTIQYNGYFHLPYTIFNHNNIIHMPIITLLLLTLLYKQQ
ncbi:hypothetical protein RCL_jg25562.t1 [Rhizophagus clarus]|uniref:Uncharacterized protein n=1 Tax=Rhizophagus clarus TaxID=94130 RepID=A0A8H3LL33_9GLOM|nr:hypothetical protein RCL_jg25562.t1 [Rhizophagus clarus]